MKDIIKAITELVEKSRDRRSFGVLAIAGGVVILALLPKVPQSESNGLFIVWGAGLCALLLIIIGMTLSIIGRIGQSKKEEPGFYIKEGRTEVRFFDWEQEHHREVYEKYFNVIPTRDGPIEIFTLSGSCSPKDIVFYHTHSLEKQVSKGDKYHVKSTITVKDAMEGKPTEIFQKSMRNYVPNKSDLTESDEVRAHPMIKALGIFEDDRWFVVLHVLYPTKKLSFKADLTKYKAQVDTIEVHKFTDTTIEPVVKEKVEVIGQEKGNLQILKWEKKNVESGTDYIVSWKWQL